MCERPHVAAIHSEVYSTVMCATLIPLAASACGHGACTATDVQCTAGRHSAALFFSHTKTTGPTVCVEHSLNIMDIIIEVLRKSG